MGLREVQPRFKARADKAAGNINGTRKHYLFFDIQNLIVLTLSGEDAFFPLQSETSVELGSHILLS